MQHRWPKMGHLFRAAHRYNRVLWVSFMFSISLPPNLDPLILYIALLYFLGENTQTVMQSFLPLLGGFGLGMLFHTPYQALTSALSPKELAAGTGAFFLVRFTGATVGLACLSLMRISFELTWLCVQSIAGAIYQSRISRNVLYGAPLESYTTLTSLNQVPIAVHAFRVCGSQDAAQCLAILNSNAGRLDHVCALPGNCFTCTSNSRNIRPVGADVTFSITVVSLLAPDAIACIHTPGGSRHT